MENDAWGGGILWARSRSGTQGFEEEVHFAEWNSITWPNLDVMETGKCSLTVGSEKRGDGFEDYLEDTHILAP